MTVNLIDTLYFKGNNNFAAGGHGREVLVHFNVNQFMLDSNIFQIGMYSAKSVYARAIVIGLIFLLSEIVLLCMVMSKKEIK